MAVNIYNIKKWYKMLRGTSLQHVNQGKGKLYSKTELKGYYNDLTEKVSDNQIVDEEGIPLLHVDNGTDIYFPITIFQYGLGSYDLYLKDRKKEFLEKAVMCAEWALSNQTENGSWKNFEYEFPQHPFSSMAQAEGVSLLLRVFSETKDNKYLEAANKAMLFLVKPIEEGGTTEYVQNEVFFHEFTHKRTVLNGWIFSVFGLFDYLLVVKDEELSMLYEKVIRTLELHLADYDNGYWSMYDCDGMITSPFYHKLHIAQLEVLYDITGKDIFAEYAQKWEKYLNNRYKKTKAFVVKALQKIVER